MAKVAWAMALHVVACGGSGDDNAQPCPGPACDAGAADGGADAFISKQGYFLLANPKLAADSMVRNRVIVLGTAADGMPTADEVVLSFDRPDTGTYTNPVVTLGPLGATSFFLPCDFSTPGCAGPLTLTAALASAPSVPIASRAVELVDPLEVNPARQCLGGGSVLYLKGNDQIFNGETMITDATFTFEQDFGEYLIMDVAPPAANGSWKLAFDLRGFGSVSLYPDVFENAVKSIAVVLSSQYDRPALDVSGFGNSCDSLAGRFEVVDYVRDGTGVLTATIAFDQVCEGSTTTSLSGCVHYQR